VEAAESLKTPKLKEALMDHSTYLKFLQRYVVNIGISAPSLRNQGAEGVVDAARRFLADLDLTPLKTLDPAAYAAWLDKTTDDLLRHLPEKARRWGAARKVTNIFMAHAALNRELAGEFGLGRLISVMETPLDKQAASGLRGRAGGHKLPRWQGVRGLTPEDSRAYQDAASDLAKAEQVPRACLDVILWRPIGPSS
jgi:hypothetical protein